MPFQKKSFKCFKHFHDLLKITKAAKTIFVIYCGDMQVTKTNKDTERHYHDRLIYSFKYYEGEHGITGWFAPLQV